MNDSDQPLPPCPLRAIVSDSIICLSPRVRGFKCGIVQAALCERCHAQPTMGYHALADVPRPAPSEAELDECQAKPRAVRGAGDLIARLASALGIKPCGGCERRRQLLNRLLPLNPVPWKSAASEPPNPQTQSQRE